MKKQIALKKNLVLIFISSILIITISCSNRNSVSQMVFPGEVWQEKSPESIGVDAAVMDSALGYFRQHAGGVGTDEMIIIRNGYIIWKGKDIEYRHELFS